MKRRATVVTVAMATVYAKCLVCSFWLLAAAPVFAKEVGIRSAVVLTGRDLTIGDVVLVSRQQVPVQAHGGSLTLVQVRVLVQALVRALAPVQVPASG